MSQILKVSRSAYYYLINKNPSNKLIRHLELGVAIKEPYDSSKSRYGSPRIAKELQMQGITVSRPLVSSIMKKKILKE